MLTILFLVLAGLLNAVMDTLQFNFSGSIFRSYTENRWFNPMGAAMNRNAVAVFLLHLMPKQLNRPITYHILYYIVSTLFVWATDLWHLAKFGMVISLAVAAYSGGINPVIGYAIFSVTFEFSYAWFLRRKND